MSMAGRVFQKRSVPQVPPANLALANACRLFVIRVIGVESWREPL